MSVTRIDSHVKSAAMKLQLEREERTKQFVSENQQEWAEAGAVYKERREAERFPVSFVSQQLGISYGRLKRFENGEPVADSNLIEAAYENFLELWKLKRQLLNLEKSINERGVLDGWKDNDRTN